MDIHSLRASFATFLAEQDVTPKVAQHLMQHSSIGLTLGLYAKLRPGRDAEAVNGLRGVPKRKRKRRARRKRKEA